MSKQIMVGNVPVGGGAPIAVQSMCNTNTADVAATAAQIRALAAAGCDIVRVAVPDMEAARAVRALKAHSPVPLVADIHFDWRLALEAVRGGIDKVRINPGNIGDADRVRAVADACRAAHVPIRVGVNGGSLERGLREKYGVTAEALCESALSNIRQLEACGFYDICVSLKSSDVFTTIRAYRLLHEKCDYPLHLGVTEAGTPRLGLLKGAAAFGALLCDGIGDTLRVTLTADPVAEVGAARDILHALGLNAGGVTVVACPTCGRTRVDLIPIAEEVERRTAGVRAKLKVAVMGCAVNGPGEAREADVGIACGLHEGLLIRKGEIIGKIPEAELVPRLLREIEELTGEKL
jgi:(E)-4-hydroxy-3-methylbut-2-enyl-diphosphate synthase